MSPAEFCVETTVPSSFIYVCRRSSSAHILVLDRCALRNSVMNSNYTSACRGSWRETLVAGVTAPLTATGMTTPRLSFAADRFVPIRGCVQKFARSKNKDRE